MATFLTFGTVWFWVFITLFIIYISYNIDDDENARAISGGIGLSLIILYFLGNSQTFKEIGKSIIDNPGLTISCFIFYIIIGVIWSLFKWTFYLKNLKSKYTTQSSLSHDMYKFEVSENKERIIGWMLYWVFSMMYTIIDQPVKKLFTEILNRTTGLYDKISKNILSEIEKNKKD